MKTKGKLLRLKKNEVCDKQTTDSLLVKDTFVQEQIDIVYDLFNKLSKTERRKKVRKEEKYFLGKKLLFLEDFLILDDKIQNQVKEWLQDPKRKLLFDQSEHGALYGELLVALAKGNLAELIADLNPYADPQPSYEYENTLKLMYVPMDIASFNKTMEMLDEKTDEKLEYLQEIYVGREFHENELRDEYNLKGIYFSDCIIEKYDSETNEVFILHRYKRYTDLETDILEVRDESELYKEAEEMSIKVFKTKVAPVLRDCVHGKLYLEDVEAKLQWMDLDEDDLFLSEIRALREEVRFTKEMFEINKKLGSKFKKEKALFYSLELSDKIPLDVRFGNDSGCCIGVYDKSKSIGNAYGLPYYMADNTILLFNICQQIGNSKKRRVGIVLAFEAFDEKGNKVLACNSTELSAAMNPPNKCTEIIDFVEAGLADFARKNSYDAAIMSSHRYNTSRKYSSKGKERCRRYETLKKIQSDIEGDFYSEIINCPDDIEVWPDSFYVIFDDRN